MRQSATKKIVTVVFGMCMLIGAYAQGAKAIMVGGAAMYPSKNIIDNAVNSKDHTTLITAVKAAGLMETLKTAGPFTIFAPTNRAFNKLPKGAVEALLKPENKDNLTKILNYHVIPGKVSRAALINLIKTNSGSYKAATIHGGQITFTINVKDIIVTDEKGSKAKLTISDVNQSNGIIHVIDTVLLP